MVAHSKGPGRELLPPRTLPFFYFSFATLCFLLAFIAAVLFASDFTGFYYHPQILAMTHLVTLGWVTSNILGFFYIVAPMTLGVRLPVTWVDVLAFCLYVIGVSGMVSHFWISHDLGTAYSAGCVYLALLITLLKWVRALPSSKAPGFVKMHILCAFTNLIVAGGWGLLISINKTDPFLRTLPSPNVLAHAHMAAIGWAMMLVFGIAYRLLPMFVPGEPAKGRMPWISGILLEIGVLGLFVSLLAQSSWELFFGLIIPAGIIIFFQQSIRVVLRRKPVPPPKPPQPDLAILQAGTSFLCLILAMISGIALTRMEPTESSLRLALLYGFLALVGFLSQIIVAMKPKILAILTWYYAFSKLEDNAMIPRPVDMPVRAFQITIFGLWLIAIPFFAAGILKASQYMIVAGAVSVLSASILEMLHTIFILRTTAIR